MAIGADRDTLHALVEAIPPERLPDAIGAMQMLADPVLLALLTAPMEDEDLSDEEVAALDEAEVESAGGTMVIVTDRELARRIGG